MKISRRYFLKSGGIAMLGWLRCHHFCSGPLLPRAAPNKKRWSCCFSAVRWTVERRRAIREPNYYGSAPRSRFPSPAAAVPRPRSTRRIFGLHPSSPLQPLFRKGNSPSCRPSARPTRPARISTRRISWNPARPARRPPRRLAQPRPPIHAREHPSPFRAVAFGPYLPRTLQGKAPAVAIPDLKQFKMYGPQQTVEGGFEAMYAQTVDQALRGVGHETFEAIDQLRKLIRTRISRKTARSIRTAGSDRA